MNLDSLLIALQAFQVLFLWLHDWVQIGRLNDVEAVRRVDPLRRRIVITLIQSVPYTIGLYFSIRAAGHPLPDGLYWYLLISYGLLFLGQLRAWWVPYLFRPEPERATRYRQMFGSTHAFLPVRNGLVPNTMHILLHLATAATLLILILLARQNGISHQM
jgi:hypothetical protein